jgi:hypothetical protein
MKRKQESTPRWRVTVSAGARAREITELLQAETAGAAIKRAIREHGIKPERAKRLAAHRWRDNG